MSLIGTKRTSQPALIHVRFLGKADIDWKCRDVRFRKADMCGSGLVLCKLTPEPHSGGRKFLM
jgi:hypothetical protein